jgi:DNA-binding CsgD family transcriptional regulator
MRDRTEMLEKLAQACNGFDGAHRDFCRLMRQRVRPLMDFNFAVAGITAPIESNLRLTTIVGVDAPARIVRAIRLASHVVSDTAFRQLVTTSKPLLLSSLNIAASDTPPWLRLLCVWPTVLHSYTDNIRNLRTHFLFVGIKDHADQAMTSELDSITPCLHLAMRRLSWPESSSMPLGLTPAEQEVLWLLLHQKSNKEIARLLGKSCATVRNQLHAIYGKLNVRSRGAAVMQIYNTPSTFSRL